METVVIVAIGVLATIFLEATLCSPGGGWLAVVLPVKRCGRPRDLLGVGGKDERGGVPRGSKERKGCLVLGHWLSFLSLKWYLRALLLHKVLRA